MPQIRFFALQWIDVWPPAEIDGSRRLIGQVDIVLCGVRHFSLFKHSALLLKFKCDPLRFESEISWRICRRSMIQGGAVCGARARPSATDVSDNRIDYAYCASWCVREFVRSMRAALDTFLTRPVDSKLSNYDADAFKFRLLHYWCCTRCLASAALCLCETMQGRAVHGRYFGVSHFGC